VYATVDETSDEGVSDFTGDPDEKSENPAMREDAIISKKAVSMRPG
jgi:hypothetical protein